MGQVLTKAGILLAIMAIGYLLKSIRMVRSEDATLLGKIVLNVTIPGAVVSSVARCTFAPEMLWLIVISLLSQILLMAVGFWAERRSGRVGKAFGVVNYSGSNIACFALPYVQSFLGPNGVLAVCLMDIGNSIVCLGGSYAVAQTILSRQETGVSRNLLRKIFSTPSLLACFATLALRLAGVSLPGAVIELADTIGKANAVLAMLMIGVAMELKLDRGRIRQILKMLLVRYGVAVLLCAAALTLAPFDAEIRSSMALIALAPVALANTAFTVKINGDVPLSGTWNSVSILVSTVLMLVLMLFLG